MQRRFTAGFAAAAAAALVLTGCSAGSSAGDGQSEDSLTWAMWIAGKEDKAAWQEVADTVQTDDDVDVTIQGSPFNDYWTKLRTQLSTGTAPCIVSIQSLRTANYTDVLVPIDDMVEKAGLDLSEYDQTGLDGMKVDGELYGLPYDTGPMLMFYNKDIFEEAGVAEPEPGWTVDDFEAAAEELKAAGTPIWGTSVEDIPLESMILGYNGGRVIDEDGGLDAENADFAEGLDWIGGLVEDGYATQASTDPSADDNAFVSGDVAMYSDGPWSIISQKAKVQFDLGITTMPSGTDGPSSYAAGSGFGIAKQCEFPEQAFAAISTMTNEATLTSLAEQGRAFPARTAAQQAWYDNAGIDGVEDALQTALDDATPLPGNKQSDQLNQLFAQYALQAVNGQTSGKETMSSIASQLGSQ